MKAKVRTVRDWWQNRDSATSNYEVCSRPPKHRGHRVTPAVLYCVLAAGQVLRGSCRVLLAGKGQSPDPGVDLATNTEVGGSRRGSCRAEKASRGRRLSTPGRSPFLPPPAAKTRRGGEGGGAGYHGYIDLFCHILPGSNPDWAPNLTAGGSRRFTSGCSWLRAGGSRVSMEETEGG